jgi:hypothetical protein
MIMFYVQWQININELIVKVIQQRMSHFSDRATVVEDAKRNEIMQAWKSAKEHSLWKWVDLSR